MDIDLKARLLMGLDVAVHGITIKNHKLGTIFKDIGLTKYIQASSLINRSPKDFFKKEFINEVKHLNMFDIFCISGEFNEVFIQFISLFTDYKWSFISTDVFTEFHTVNEFGNRVHINRDNFDDVMEVIRVMYCLDKSKRESDRQDIDDEMAALLREFEDEEEKVRRSKGGNITIVSIIDGVASKHHSINLLSIWEYTVYQLIHTYYKLNQIDNETNVKSAIYTGNIDAKKIELDKMHWATELEQ